MKYGTKKAVLTRHMDEKRSRDKHWFDRPEHADMRYDDGYDTRHDMGARFRDRRGREHYDNGRYAPKGEFPDYYPVPPVYKEETMNRIGFAYPMDATHHQTGDHHSGMSRGDISHEHVLTEEMAAEWMRGLHNEDGTTGPHWSKVQVAQVIAQRNLDIDLTEAWVALNAIYSDYCKVAKANNVNSVDFYVGMAKAFLDDKDAHPNKLALYYQYIVK